jgi:UDP-N-acetylglucosamine 2-epimerase (non-hydrolysing)
MNIAPENSVAFLTRHVKGRSVRASSLLAGPVLHAIGSRSEAVRLASVVAALRASGVPQVVSRLVGPDGQEGDVFDATGVPRTGALVDSEPSSRVQRTARALAAAERTLEAQAPSMLVLGGDADVTLAFALAGSKLGIPIARVGGGLRCGDFSVSEEINRIMTDRLSDLLFTDSHDAADLLKAEGIGGDRVHTAGNTAVDLLRYCEDDARRRSAWRRFGVQPGRYVLATLHRAENLGDDERLARTAEAIAELARRIPVVFPVHPLTRRLMEPMGDVARLEAAGVKVAPPLGYLDFLSLQQAAGAILTDSGGVQDEASALGVRCFTLRRATERVVTLAHGTNVLLGEDPDEIAGVAIDQGPPDPAAIPLWDGRAGERVAAALTRRLSLQLAS